MNLDDFFLPEPELRKEMQRTMEWARDVLVKHPDDNFIPHLTALTRERPGAEIKCVMHALAVDNWNEPAQRRLLLMGLGARFYREQTVPIAAFLVSDAWTAKIKPGEAAGDLGLRPDRQEVLSAFGLGLDGKTYLHAHIDIARVRGIMRPCSDWIWSQGKVSCALLDKFFQGFMVMVRDDLKAKGWPV